MRQRAAAGCAVTPAFGFGSAIRTALVVEPHPLYLEDTGLRLRALMQRVKRPVCELCTMSRWEREAFKMSSTCFFVSAFLLMLFY